MTGQRASPDNVPVERVERGHSDATGTPGGCFLAEKNALECGSEVRREDRVNDRIEHRVDVAKPQEEAKDGLGEVALLAAEWH